MGWSGHDGSMTHGWGSDVGIAHSWGTEWSYTPYKETHSPGTWSTKTTDYVETTNYIHTTAFVLSTDYIETTETVILTDYIETTDTVFSTNFIDTTDYVFSTDFVETTTTATTTDFFKTTTTNFVETTKTLPAIIETTTFTTVETVNRVKTVTQSILEVKSGETITVLNPSYTIPNVTNGPPCPSAPIQSYYDIQWYYWAPPSAGIPPLATHQPIVYPDGATSTSVYCNTTVFEKYLRTQRFDCNLGRGPYQTLDCDCNIIVGPIFTGNGPKPTGPGITVTQRGASGVILDLGTSISANYIPVTKGIGQTICASTTTTVLSTPLIYYGPVTIVPSFYRTVRIQERQDLTGTTTSTNLVLPSLKSSTDNAPFTQPHAVILSEPKDSTQRWPGGNTTTLPPTPAAPITSAQPVSGSQIGGSSSPASSAQTTPSASPETSSTATTPTTKPSPTPTTSSSPGNSPAQSSTTVVQSSSPATLSPGNNLVHTTNVCQMVTYTGRTGFIVPELSVGANNSTVTETDLAAELTAGIDSYVCSVVGGCEGTATSNVATGSGGAITTGAAGVSSSGAPSPASATGQASVARPPWLLFIVAGLGWLAIELLLS